MASRTANSILSFLSRRTALPAKSPLQHGASTLRTTAGRRAFNSRTARPRAEARRPASPFESARAAFRKRFSSATSGSQDGLGARMKKLSREYGWSALGVYLALSALDFPFCYLLVRYLGTDLIGEWEHYIVSHAKQLVPESIKTTYSDWRQSMKKAERELTGAEEVNDGVDMVGWGVEEADKQNKKEASLGTQLALAYAIHKSFIFIRVPLTAAVTPKVVKILRGWGWDIGKRTTKAAKEAAKAVEAAKKAGKP